MLSVSSMVACLMVASIAAQVTPSAQPPVSSATAALGKTPTRNSRLNSPMTNQTMAVEGDPKSPALDPVGPSATIAELDSPTSTTTAAPAASGPTGATGTAVKNLKTNYQNGTHSAANNSSRSAEAPISRGTFSYMTTFLSAGLLTLVL